MFDNKAGNGLLTNSVKNSTMSKTLRANVKQHGGIESIRENSRNEAHCERRNKLYNCLFLKRTKINYDDFKQDNGDGEMLSIEDIRVLINSLKKKSDRTEDILKTLTKAFIFNNLLVGVFLETENSLWTLTSYMTGKDSTLQIYSCYCVANITAADHGKGTTIAKMCAPYLIAYLSSSDPLKQDICATALGNLAADGQELRDLLKKQGILKPLVELFRVSSTAVFESACFAAIQMSAGSDDVINELYTLGIGELLIKSFKSSDNNEVNENISWLLIYLASSKIHAKKLVELGLLGIIVKKLQHCCAPIKDNLNGLTALVRLLGNCITTADPLMIQSFGYTSLFDSLVKLHCCNHTYLVKESLWALSNIISMEEEVALGAVDNNIVLHVTRCLNYGYDIQIQAVKCVCILASYGGLCIEAVVSPHTLDYFIKSLSSEMTELQFLAIQFIEMVLRLHCNGTKLLMQRNIITELENVVRNMTLPEICDAVKDMLQSYFYEK